MSVGKQFRQARRMRYPDIRATAVMIVLALSMTLLTVQQAAFNDASALSTSQGDGLAVYGQAASTTSKWRTWTNASNTFGSASNATTTSYSHNMTVRASPTKQEAIMVTSQPDNTNYASYIYVSCYDGTSWTNEWNFQTWGTGASKYFDVAYETASGDVMVVYSTSASGSNQMQYRTKPGNTGCGSANWSAATSITTTRTSNPVNEIHLAWDRRSSSNVLALAWMAGNGSDWAEGGELSARMWSGTSWSAEPSVQLESTVDRLWTRTDVPAFDIDFESSSGNVMLVWGAVVADDTNGAKYVRCTGGSASCTWGTVTAMPTFADRASSLDISANPISTSNEIVFASVGSVTTGDLQIGYWNGSAWTNSANVDTTAASLSDFYRTVATGWTVNGSTARSVIVYADNDATSSNLSWYSGSGGTFTAQSDFTIAAANARAITIEMNPFDTSQLMTTIVDANNDLWFKKLSMTSAPVFTWSHADGNTAIDTGLYDNTPASTSFAYWRNQLATYTQSAYRWYAESTALDPSTALANQNTPASAAAGRLRLRTQMSVADGPLAANAQDYKLQYATSTGGPWNDVSAPGGGWWDGGGGGTWTKRRKISFNNASRASNLTNFTVLVKLSSSNIDYASVQNSGQDLRFLDASGTVLNYEIELWNESGTSYVWVKVPQIDASSSTDYMWMYYGNASASAGQSATGTWDSSYRLVHHMEEQPNGSTGQTYYDSTSYANNATNSGWDVVRDTSGQVGNAVGIAQFSDINTGTDNQLPHASAMTGEFWIKPTTAIDAYRILYSDTDDGSATDATFTMSNASSGTGVSIKMQGGDECSTASGLLPNNTWTHVAISHSGTEAIIYVNGTERARRTDGWVGTSSGGGYQIGTVNQRTNMDEVRVSAGVRSADWISAVYASETAALTSFGTEENGSGSVTWGFYNGTPTGGATITASRLSSTTLQSYVEANPTPTNPNAIAAGGSGEWDFSLDGTTAPDGTYYFRMVTSSGGTLNTYAQYPEITIGVALSQSAYRWYANNNANTPTTSLTSNQSSLAYTPPGQVRLRTQVGATNGGLTASSQAFSLQYATSTSGPWSAVGASAGWWNGGGGGTWTKRRKITFDNSGQAENLTNFPVAVILNSGNIDYANTQNAGQDLRFLDGDNTVLSYEIEKWDEAGTSTVWVKVPQIDSSSSTDYIWMYYGNASATAGESAANVWDTNYKLVQHMEEASGTNFTDSTSNAQNGTSSGTIARAVAGKTGPAVTMSSASTASQIGNATAPNIPHKSAFTVEFWVKPGASMPAWTQFVMDDTAGGEASWVSEVGNSANRLGLEGSSTIDSPSVDLSTGTWTHVVMTHSGTTGTVYANAVSRVSGAMTYKTNTGVGYGISNNYNTVPYTLDEVRISSTVRSLNWIKATYATQNNTFNTFAGEESGGSGDWGFYDATPADGATLSASVLSGTTALQSYEENNPTVNNVNAIASGGYGEWDFSLNAANAPNGTYYFRMVLSDGTPLDTYSVYPAISVGPTIDAQAYRFFNNLDSANVGTPLAAQNTAATSPTIDTAFRLRTRLHATGRSIDVGAQQFKLQFAEKSGTCDTAYSGESYQDIGAATAISFYSTGSIADGAALTTNANDPTSAGGYTLRAQSVEKANNFSGILSAAANEDGMWDFSLVAKTAAAGKTYCFRTIYDSGGLLATPMYVPEIAVPVANVAPNNSFTLSQTVSGVSGWNNTTSITFGAVASDPDAGDSIQLCVEKDTLGTSFSGNPDSCGTLTATPGANSNTNLSHTISGLSNPAQYHWQAYIKDAGGLASTWSPYNTADINSRDFGIDTTSPTGGVVYDGSTPGVDVNYGDGGSGQLSGNWSGFDSNLSGTQYYEYSIGTTAGGTTIKGWTNVGTSTSATATGLTLQTDVPYYWNVRVRDNANNTVSGVVSSDGQFVAPLLQFSISDTNLVIGNLSASNSYSATTNTNMTVITNALNGYAVRAKIDAQLTSSGGTIPHYASAWSAPTVWSGTGFGYTSSDPLVVGSDRFGVGVGSVGTKYARFITTNPGDVVMDDTAGGSYSRTLGLKVQTPASQYAGKYLGSITFSCVAQF